MVESFADDIFRGLLQIGMQLGFILSLYKVAARRHKPRDGTNVWLGALGFGLQI